MNGHASGPAGASSPGPGTPVPIKAIPVRHYGRWIAAVVVLAIFAIVINAFADANVRWGVVPDYMFKDAILDGVWNTIKITVVSMALGLALGVIFAIMRLSSNPVTNAVAWFYVWFFRGTPVYVQLVVWFNLAIIFPTVHIPGIIDKPTYEVMTPFLAALFGLGINEGAYMAEIVRAGIISVDEGQTEAAQALGMSKFKTMRRIVLPQAMRVIIPPTGNEFINLLKTSSLCVAVQYDDLFAVTSDIGGQSSAVPEMLAVACAWYLILTSVLSIGQYYVERHYSKGKLRSLPPTPFQRVRRLVFSVRRPEVPRT